MKKYIKPTLEVENYELNKSIAALSNVNGSLGVTDAVDQVGDNYTWDSFWN